MSGEAIPFYEPGERLSAINGSPSPIVGQTFVNIFGNKNTGDPRTISVKTCPAGLRPVGVAGWDCIAGERLTVLAGPGMVVPVTTGGIVAAGAEVEVNATGQAITLASGKAAGMALDGAASGATAMIKLY